MTEMAQVQLHFGEGFTRSLLTCWVPVDDKPFRVGDHLRLKSSRDEISGVLWTVDAIGEQRRDSASLHTDWQVGGIDRVDRG